MIQTILSILASILGLAILVGRMVGRKRKKRKEAADEAGQGVDERDPSLITGGFDKLRGMR